MTRIQVDMPEERVREIEELMEKRGIKTKKEFFNVALTLLEWAIDEKENGHAIASVDEEENRYKEVVIPGIL